MYFGSGTKQISVVIKNNLIEKPKNIVQAIFLHIPLNILHSIAADVFSFSKKCKLIDHYKRYTKNTYVLFSLTLLIRMCTVNITQTPFIRVKIKSPN